MRYKDEMVQALEKEALAETGYLQGETIQTIYFGGGTPSLLETSDIRSLLNTIRHHYKLASFPEITLEANPDDISIEKLEGWKNAGINRLSIGVQSFFEEELRWMNRAHTSEQAISNLQLAREHFDNITIDLIYGSPLLTDEMWKQNVDRVIDMNIPHLSCYALTVEEKTPLYKMIRNHQTTDVDTDKQARQFLLLMQWLRQNGYEHYEVSNFARPGYRSRHNSSYWKGEKYLGLGPSAHSYNGLERRWNVANNQLYIRIQEKSEGERERELLTPVQKLNEYIMISLRTSEGLDLSRIEKEWGEQEAKRIAGQIKPYMDAKLILRSEKIYQLTDEGMLRADGIASDMFGL